MSYVADALASRLIATGVAQAGATFVDALPEAGDAVLALWDTVGQDLPALGCHSPVTAGRVQLLVRGAIGDMASTRRRAWQAYQALGTMAAITMAVNDEGGASVNVSVLAINFDGPPSLIERDHTERPLFSANATVWFSIGVVG